MPYFMSRTLFAKRGVFSQAFFSTANTYISFLVNNKRIEMLMLCAEISNSGSFLWHTSLISSHYTGFPLLLIFSKQSIVTRLFRTTSQKATRSGLLCANTGALVKFPPLKQIILISAVLKSQIRLIFSGLSFLISFRCFQRTQDLPLNFFSQSRDLMISTLWLALLGDVMRFVLYRQQNRHHEQGLAGSFYQRYKVISFLIILLDFSLILSYPLNYLQLFFCEHLPYLARNLEWYFTGYPCGCLWCWI